MKQLEQGHAATRQFEIQLRKEIVACLIKVTAFRKQGLILFQRNTHKITTKKFAKLKL